METLVLYYFSENNILNYSSECLKTKTEYLDLSRYVLFSNIKIFIKNEIHIVKVENGLLDIRLIPGIIFYPHKKYFFWLLKDELYYNNLILKIINDIFENEKIETIKMLYDLVFYKIKIGSLKPESNGKIKPHIYRQFKNGMYDNYIIHKKNGEWAENEINIFIENYEKENKN